MDGCKEIYCTKFRSSYYRLGYSYIYISLDGERGKEGALFSGMKKKKKRRGRKKESCRGKIETIFGTRKRGGEEASESPLL